jgi:glycosyltransferase involved in cell wall biosynthesis
MPESVATISVVTPNYNHAHYLQRCVQCVASQHVAAFEHVIVDDGSTDCSRELILDLAARFSFVRPLFHEHNQGVALALKHGIAAATGRFVICLAADDMLLPNAIEEFSNVLRGHPDAALVCGEIEYRREKKTWRRHYISAEDPIHMTPKQLAQYQRSMLTVVNGTSAVRREYILDSPLFDPQLEWLGDMVAYTIIAYRKGLWYVPRTVLQFTVGDANMSAKSRIWKFQKPVIARVFAILLSPKFSDIRSLYRSSAALAEISLIARYMVCNPSTWQFLTFRLIVNIAIFAAYRRLRSLVPPSFIEMYIDLRSYIFRKRTIKEDSTR